MPSGVYKRTNKHKQKLKELAKNGSNSSCFSNGHKKGMTGKKHKSITRLKICNTLTGKKHSKERKEKNRQSHLGDKHWNWQNGKSFEEYSIDWTDDLKESIRKRDNYICQECGIHQDELSGWNKKLDVHHVDYDKNNLNPNNLIALCRSCHTKTNYNRKYWIEYFKKYEQ